jgi:hypothetical protein
MSTKKIGITCDDYKATAFRKGLLKEGLTLEYDGPSGIAKVHLFRIQVDAADYSKKLDRIGKITTRLEFNFKNAN